MGCMMHLQQPKSMMSNPRHLNLSLVSNRVEFKYALKYCKRKRKKHYNQPMDYEYEKPGGVT